MENRLRPGTQVGSKLASHFESLADPSKRTFLRAAGLLIAGLMAPQARARQSLHGAADTGHKVVVVIIGGVRQAETFSPEGLANIPHLSADLLPRALFYPRVRNEGVTAHFNAISSILTGNWQRVDDWGKLAPTTPTVFEQFRKRLHLDRSETWVVASNKALTNLIGASSASDYGPAYGANVVFPKQLMLTAVAEALRREKPALASALERATSVTLEGDEVVLAFSAGDRFQGEVVLKEKELLASRFSSLFSHPVRLRLAFQEARQEPVAVDQRVELLRKVFRGEIVKGEGHGDQSV